MASMNSTAYEKRYGIKEKRCWACPGHLRSLNGIKRTAFHFRNELQSTFRNREKPILSNVRVKRWIGKIQEFDFQVKYSPGEEMGIEYNLS